MGAILKIQFSEKPFTFVKERHSKIAPQNIAGGVKMRQKSTLDKLYSGGSKTLKFRMGGAILKIPFFQKPFTFVKGRDFENAPQNIVHGVKMHEKNTLHEIYWGGGEQKIENW